MASVFWDRGFFVFELPFGRFRRLYEGRLCRFDGGRSYNPQSWQNSAEPEISDSAKELSYPIQIPRQSVRRDVVVVFWRDFLE